MTQSDAFTYALLVALLIVSVIAGFVAKARSVSQKELMHSKADEVFQQNRVLTIVNNLADAVLSINETGIINVYNAASLNLLDTNSSLFGRQVSDVLKLRVNDTKMINILSDLAQSRGTVVRDDLSITIGDEIIRLEVTCSPIRSSYDAKKKSETGEGYVLILRDITKSKSLEEERDEFIGVVSHELRTPITIAEGTISNLQLMMSRGVVAHQVMTTAIESTHEQIVFLSKMVNDLSALSRAENGTANSPEPVDVRRLVNALYAEYSPQAAKKGLRFNLDATARLGQVEASPLYLKELLQNFITNALKYTKEGAITFRAARRDTTILFEVSDTGIGISKSDQEKVFRKFYRSEDYRTRETGGTGLGLYVATKLAKRMGATIVLRSRLNHGSTFSFELPVSEKTTLR